MAYLRPLPNQCDQDRCEKPATLELRGRNNVGYGKFCAVHGRQRLRQLEQREKERSPQEDPIS